MLESCRARHALRRRPGRDRPGRLLRRSGLVVAIGFLSLAVAQVLRASVPSPRVPGPPSLTGGGAVFGIIEADAAGRPFFVRSDSVPNVEGQAYGWFIEVGDSRLPVQWTETLSLPAPAGSWSADGESPPANVSISPDRRSAVVRDEAIPEFGVVYHFWVVVPGDPSGRYAITVKLESGREERFAFILLPEAGSGSR